MKEPIALIFFRRETVFKVLDEIKKYKPEKLFLISDGGRNEEEHKICLKIRHDVEKKINWNCGIFKHYSDTNLGCRKNIPRGLDDVFKVVDRVIILEDDCVPSQDFFLFCELMLEYYKENERIFTISGSNYLSNKYLIKNCSYFFSGYAETCGWATWKRCWDLYDADLKKWPEWKKKNILGETFLGKNETEYWHNIFDQVFSKTITCDPWDYQWLCLVFANKALSIVPNVNLITNIGFGPLATHVTSDSILANKPHEKIIFPIVHPIIIKRNKKYDKAYSKLVFNINRLFYIKMLLIIFFKKIKIYKIIKKIYHFSDRYIKYLLFWSGRKEKPISRLFGFDRGTPIDRYYIDKYLTENQKDIQGNVLEIAENTYSKKFGLNVSSYGILHYDNSNKNATIIGDLTKLETLPEEKIDCFICTQTLNFIFDVQKAISGCYKLLKQGGVLLCTVSGISQISRYDMDRWGDYWRFTDLSIRKLFEKIFDKDNITITTYGNVLSAAAFLQGLSVEDLSRKKLLDKHDIDYEVTIGIRAIK